MVREFDRDKDYPMVEDWFHDQGRYPIPFSMLPKLGVVVFNAETKDDVAALWLYMDNSCGVCFPEHAIAKTGLGMLASKRALLTALQFLRKRAAEPDLNYGIMWINTPPTFAKVIERNLVSSVVGTGKVSMIALTREEA